MKRLVITGLLTLAALATLAVAPGCSSKSKSKSSPRIASEVEESFRQRWIAKRMGELQASGKAADARQARRMATDEFKQRFAFTSIAQNPDPTIGVTQ
jgi:hypothetical protein